MILDQFLEANLTSLKLGSLRAKKSTRGRAQCLKQSWHSINISRVKEGRNEKDLNVLYGQTIKISPCFKLCFYMKT